MYKGIKDNQDHHAGVNEKLTNQNFTYVPVESNNFEYLYGVIKPLYLPVTPRKKEINGRWKKEGTDLLPYRCQ